MHRIRLWLFAFTAGHQSLSVGKSVVGLSVANGSAAAMVSTVDGNVLDACTLALGSVPTELSVKPDACYDSHVFCASNKVFVVSSS